MNRPNRQATSAADVTPPAGHGRKTRIKESGLVRLASMALLVSISILAVALVWFVVLGKPNSEAQRVDNERLQAVFLNGGQVYFGRVTHLNDQYMRLRNIYYLRVNQQVQPDDKAKQEASDISLVKLGCELHGPQDEMLINRDQVIFWENLKDDGQVAKAVDKYIEQNPNGQNCEAQSSTEASN